MNSGGNFVINQTALLESINNKGSVFNIIKEHKEEIPDHIISELYSLIVKLLKINQIKR